MTQPTIHPTTPQLVDHARQLASAFKVFLFESAQLAPDNAFATPLSRCVYVSTIVDETTYAVALHELGHVCSPTGIVRHVVEGDAMNLKRLEEAAAWEWARHYALVWTPAMESVASWAEGTYQRQQQRQQQQAPAAPASPAAPAAPQRRINWAEWSAK